MAIGFAAVTVSGCGTPQCADDRPEAIAPSWVLNFVERDAGQVEVVAVQPEGEPADRAIVTVRVDGARVIAVVMERAAEPGEFGCRWQVVGEIPPLPSPGP